DLVLDYDAVSPLAQTEGWIASGLNGGTWDGNGLITSQPAALNQLTTLGIAEASNVLGLGAGDTAVFSGFTVDSTSVLVKYTYAGDANLDGTINADDYAAIDFYSPQAGASGYFNGDFNHDGAINADDYSLIDFNNSS